MTCHTRFSGASANREWNGSAGWQQRQQIIAEKAEAINQRILKARAERLRAELSKIESALGGS